MYYHIRLDKIKHDACTDMDARRVWDFRSLHAALEMIKREFGSMAQSWSICDLTEQTEDIFKLEPILEKALPSVHQYLVMLFRRVSLPQKSIIITSSSSRFVMKTNDRRQKE